jgi:hypothetical protein
MTLMFLKYYCELSDNCVHLFASVMEIKVFRAVLPLSDRLSRLNLLQYCIH